VAKYFEIEKSAGTPKLPKMVNTLFKAFFFAMISSEDFERMNVYHIS
jgi:hypothetical protein